MLCSITLSSWKLLPPLMISGALVSVRPVTWVPPPTEKVLLPPLIAGVPPLGVEMNSPLTWMTLESEIPAAWADMSRMLKCEPTFGVAIDRLMLAAPAKTVLWLPVGAKLESLKVRP